MTDVMERLLRRIEIDDNGCWLWTGAQKGNGYGMIWSGGKRGVMWLTHRVAYLNMKGPIPVGQQIDHLCRVRNCCNPDHLEVVTQRENVLRGTSITAVNARKTHCQNGHPFTGDNLMIIKANGQRRCRTCWLEYSAAYKRKWREARRAAGEKVT